MSSTPHAYDPHDSLIEPQSIERDILTRPILGFVSEAEIHAALETALDEYPEEARRYVYPDVFRSEHYQRIVFGTLGELIALLRSFENKSPCGYAHETKRIVAGILLSPENCRYQEGYSGCGHPEKTGLLIAMTLAELLLQKRDSSSGRMAHSAPPKHIILFLQDGFSALTYARRGVRRNADGTIPLSPEIRASQESLGREVLYEAYFLSDRLFELYVDQSKL